MRTVARRLVPHGVVLSSLLLGGCLLAAAGAGAGGGIYLTSRGAETKVDMTVPQLAQRTEAEFRARNIAIQSSKVEKGGDEREYTGKAGDLDVTVKLKRENPTRSKIEVSARRNLATWDKGYAQDLLAKIIK